MRHPQQIDRDRLITSAVILFWLLVIFAACVAGILASGNGG